MEMWTIPDMAGICGFIPWKIEFDKELMCFASKLKP